MILDMKATIPQEILKAAEGRKFLGGTLKKICRYKGEDVYEYEYPVPMIVGMPEFYLWNGKRARIIENFDALSLLSRLPI